MQNICNHVIVNPTASLDNKIVCSSLLRTAVLALLYLNGIAVEGIKHLCLVGVYQESVKLLLLQVGKHACQPVVVGRWKI